MNQPCGCCEGIERATPMPTANRPGLNALAFRVGTHASFLETMMARLSDLYLEVPVKEGSDEKQRIYPLRNLTTRAGDDPAIALLDAWATVADVLTFYQERIANEGYLRTATERRSILELARLVGYALRPGVAASVYLAFTLENGHTVEIPVGARAQSLPGPGETMQSFETAEKLPARDAWNNLKPRLTRPQQITRENAETIDALYFKGYGTNLKPNDPLLLVFGDDRGRQVFRHVRTIEPILAENAAETRTKVTLKEPPAPRLSTTSLGELIEALQVASSRPPANAQRLERSVAQSFAREADMGLRVLGTFQPALQLLPSALGTAMVTSPSSVRVYALRVTARPFGHNAPKKILEIKGGAIKRTGEWPIVEVPATDQRSTKAEPVKHEEENIIYLDASYEKILPNSWVVVDTRTISDGLRKQFTNFQISNGPLLIAKADEVHSTISRAEYGLSGGTTSIRVPHPWILFKKEELQDSPDAEFQLIRRAVVYAQSEELPLAEEPIGTCVGPTAEDSEAGRRIELARLYDGLDSGRWLIVSGERVIPGTSGVRASELVMLAGVTQDLQKIPSSQNQKTDLAGDKIHSFLRLAEGLAYCYKRDTVTIYGNVVKATHGETRNEVLGSGDGSKALQQFALRQSLLTYLAASTPAGAESTLHVRVNDILWHETDSLAGLGRTARNFIARTDDADKTTVIFGNGEHGARLPTGVENVRAVYRTGIGKPGNVKAEQISLLATKPLGVKAVINPLGASGGADRDNRDQARRNAPLAVMALDRLVSVQDYADFARTFAGIGKASAARLSDGRRKLVHVTIAGVDDIPIEVSSDLYRHLFQALHQSGDPYEPIQVQVRELVLLIISAKVRVLPDYQWESVEPKIRAALLDTFGFDRRELGQDALLSEVISTIQRVEGVEYVDVDTFGGIPERVPDENKPGKRRVLTPEEIVTKVQELVKDSKNSGPQPRIPVNLADFEQGSIRPAQIAYPTPAVPDTLILTELTK